mmetsp:Transcript_70127/g.226949  ORF Transcript_70127/g.226949 Transcript_70127/m.226949 type:complete len:208 (-) Transcript_70127:1291-1914(-)
MCQPLSESRLLRPAAPSVLSRTFSPLRLSCKACPFGEAASELMLAKILCNVPESSLMLASKCVVESSVELARSDMACLLSALVGLLLCSQPPAAVAAVLLLGGRRTICTNMSICRRNSPKMCSCSSENLMSTPATSKLKPSCLFHASSTFTTSLPSAVALKTSTKLPLTSVAFESFERDSSAFSAHCMCSPKMSAERSDEAAMAMSM